MGVGVEIVVGVEVRCLRGVGWLGHRGVGEVGLWGYCLETEESRKLLLG